MNLFFCFGCESSRQESPESFYLPMRQTSKFDWNKQKKINADFAAFKVAVEQCQTQDELITLLENFPHTIMGHSTFPPHIYSGDQIAGFIRLRLFHFVTNRYGIRDKAQALDTLDSQQSLPWHHAQQSP